MFRHPGGEIMPRVGTRSLELPEPSARYADRRWGGQRPISECAPDSHRRARVELRFDVKKPLAIYRSADR